MKHSILLLLSCMLITISAMAQKGQEPSLANWKKADSLINRGLPESAEGLVNELYTSAKRDGDAVQTLKAQLFLMRIHNHNQEQSDSSNIALAEAQIRATGFPYQAVWRSIAAQLYWGYYQEHRYKILSRTIRATGSEADASAGDFEQWDAQQFFKKCSSLYTHSLDEAERLKTISILELSPVLEKGKNTLSLRPTLFDLLAFRALDFFENDEKDLTAPAYQFVMDDPAAFADATKFIRHDFASRDTLSEQWQALRLYQEVLAMHHADTKPDAFLDADLKRLEFAFRYSVNPEKTTLYRQALEQIETKYASHRLSALASFRLARLMMGLDENETSEQPQVNLNAVLAKLDSIIAKFPGSEGGIDAMHLRQNILASMLSLETEEAILPGRPSKVLLRYKNIPEVYFRVVKLDPESYFHIDRQRGDSAFINRLLRIRPVQAFQLSLPGTKDLRQHSTEVKIDSLPLGMYAIFISAKPSFQKTDNDLSFALCQSTELALLIKNAPGSNALHDADGYVVQRETGVPIPDVRVDFYRQEWQRNQSGYVLNLAESFRTNATGAFHVKSQANNFYGLALRKGADVFYSDSYLNFYRYHSQPKDSRQVLFFTDRSIYRPGQSIFFKAILLRESPVNRSAAVIADEELILKFFDANRQEVGRQVLRTNEWGSVSGTFKAPQGGLSGTMRIAAFDQNDQQELGEVRPTVEAYKRPKFRIGWDSLKQDFVLNEAISIQGHAVAYAGNNIDGAVVKYRVVRQVRWPFWWFAWRFAPQGHSSEQQMASGTTTTDANGTFKITFDALPDQSIDARSLPVFCYRIYADVTDLNGETRSGETQVSIGYRSLQIVADIPAQSSRKEVGSWQISSQNLNGDFVATAMHIQVARLQQPKQIYRKRYWPVPDQFVMSEAVFHKAFPLDAYKDEDDYRNWKEQSITAEQSLITTPKSNIRLPENAFPDNGWYCITISAKDKQGKAVEEKKFVQIWDAFASGSTYSALNIWPQTQSREPGEQADIKVISDLGALHLIRQVQYIGGSEISLRHMHASGTDEWHKNISEDDRGGIAVSYITVRDNRVYQVSAPIHVPWKNKELHIEWETHRNKLLPGQQEQWTLLLRGEKKEQVAAELVATLYDASLDAFKPHSWQISSLFPSLSVLPSWIANIGFEPVGSRGIATFQVSALPGYAKSYYQIAWLNDIGQNNWGLLYDREGAPSGGRILSATSMRAAEPLMKKDSEVSRQKEAPASSAKPIEALAAVEFPIRKNLQETAFFFPQLHTDSTGAIRISFTIPEALTEWKLMAFAHTKDLCTGLLNGNVKTQKDLMVQPELPRFLRQGDAIQISSKIVNLSEGQLRGTAKIEIVDALNGKVLNTAFRLAQTELPFSLQQDASGTVSWLLHVPESRYEPMIIRISAKAGAFTDGEENILPVLTNRMLVTETLPLWMNGSGQKHFSFEKLVEATSSPSMSQLGLTVEYTTNPIWNVVKALPYLIEYPYECSEQTFNRYYANALAAHIMDEAPRVKTVFKKWQEEAGQAALKSPLENNQELKSALLEETPWVLDAQSETKQQENIALLFETSKMQEGLKKDLQKLDDMMLPEGGWPWFKGGPRPNRYITQYIMTGLGRLRAISKNSADDGSRFLPEKGKFLQGTIPQEMIDKALPYLDREMEHDYRELLRRHADMKAQQIGNVEAQYLYLRSFFNDIPQSEISAEAINFFKKQAKQYWPQFNPYIKGMIAVAMYRNGEKTTSQDILQSLRETSIHKEETGMYWKQPSRSWWWYDAPIETQSLLIECFSEIAHDQTSIDMMKRWLLKQKQTQNWGTTTATADACYALLLAPSGKLIPLNNDRQVSITLGDTSIHSSALLQEAGSGYFKFKIPGVDIRPEMGNISLNITPTTSSSGNQIPDGQPSWGAIYWQYFEALDKIIPSATPLVLKKELFLEKNTDRGPVLVPISSDSISTEKGIAEPLKIGDKVRVRIEISVDRDIEYVHLKVGRAACFEPLNVLSGYRWQGGLGYYESTRDASDNFFFDYLPRGKYVFEYPMFVTNAGQFSSGIATIQCMYAPEFAAHSGGHRLKVE